MHVPAVGQKVLVVGGLLDEARADIVPLLPGVAQVVEAAQPALDARGRAVRPRPRHRVRHVRERHCRREDVERRLLVFFVLPPPGNSGSVQLSTVRADP